MMTMLAMETTGIAQAEAALRWMTVAIALSLGLIGASGLLQSRRGLCGTTLLAPWRWACFSFAMVTMSEIVIAGQGPGNSAPWPFHVRYLAGVTMLAPFVALLGAKRPQDRAWQWIVVAHLVFLALPSGKAILFDDGAPPLPHTAWRLLLAIVLASQLLNHLPTRNWPTALLVTLAQIAWLANYLPWVTDISSSYLPLAGLVLATFAICLASRPMRVSHHGREPIERVWLDYRDSYGVLWALRVAERVNASATKCGWPMRLTWGGLRNDGVQSVEGQAAQPTTEDEAMANCKLQIANCKLDGASLHAVEDNSGTAMRQHLKSLLLRFVSKEWILERLGEESTFSEPDAG
jgi:hypothetical protein